MKKFWVIQTFRGRWFSYFFTGTEEAAQQKRSDMAIQRQCVVLLRIRAKSESSSLRIKTCPNHVNYYRQPAWPQNRRSHYYCECGCMERFK